MTLEELQNKSYFTIGEIEQLTNVAKYTIRYWEKAFGLLKPIRKESGHRRYTRQDLDTILKIKELTLKHKMTLEGAKKHLSRFMQSGAKPKTSDGFYTIRDINFLKEIQKDLSQIVK